MNNNYIGFDLLLAVFVFGMGLFMTLKPDIVWKIKHLMSVRDGEPTNYYLISTRICGIFITVLSVACIGWLLFS